MDSAKPKRIKTVYGSGKKPNYLKLQKQSEEDSIIKNIKDLFKLKKENEVIKNGIITDIKTPFEEED